MKLFPKSQHLITEAEALLIISPLLPLHPRLDVRHWLAWQIKPHTTTDAPRLYPQGAVARLAGKLLHGKPVKAIPAWAMPHPQPLAIVSR